MKIILYGSDISLPEGLKIEFDRLIAKFNDVDVIDEGSLRDDAPNVRRIVYGNGIHKRSCLDFYSSLAPDEFVFFDNGISSYWNHDILISDEFQKRDLPLPRCACLTLSPPLDVPKYLLGLEICEIKRLEYLAVLGLLRRSYGAVGGCREGWSVVLGTSLFRTGVIDWDEERELYLRLVDRLERDGATVLFKPHPRSSGRPLLTASDGVKLLNAAIPVEVLAVSGQEGSAYSVSSSSLFTLKKYFGWKCYSIKNNSTAKAFERIPHLNFSSLLPSVVL